MEINYSQVAEQFVKPTINRDIQSLSEQQTEVENAVKLPVEAKVLLSSADNNGQQEENNNVQTDLSIENALAEISEFVQNNGRQLNFSVDEGSQKNVVKVTDSETGEIIRQIPSEEVLRLSERLQNLQLDVGAAVGVLFNKHV
jgi:flagellar protein FlaG